MARFRLRKEDIGLAAVAIGVALSLVLQVVVLTALWRVSRSELDTAQKISRQARASSLANQDFNRAQVRTLRNVSVGLAVVICNQLIQQPGEPLTLKQVRLCTKASLDALKGRDLIAALRAFLRDELNNNDNNDNGDNGDGGGQQSQSQPSRANGGDGQQPKPKKSPKPKPKPSPSPSPLLCVSDFCVEEP